MLKVYIFPPLSSRSQKQIQQNKPKTNPTQPIQNNQSQTTPKQTKPIMSASTQPLSIYIPRVFPNITKARIAAIFQNLDLGVVRQVDLVGRENANNEPYNMAFIHMRSWSDSVASQNFQERLLDQSREARIVYDDPWYWIVLENRNPKSDAQLVVEQRLEILEEAIAHLRMRCDGLEIENDIYSERLGEYMDEDEFYNTPLQEPYAKEDGWHVVADNEGNEYYVFDPTSTDLNGTANTGWCVADTMPQRENSDGGAPATARLSDGFIGNPPQQTLAEAHGRGAPMRENSVECDEYGVDINQHAENDALAMTGALSAENNPNLGNEVIPVWQCCPAGWLPDPTSWTLLHQEAEQFRQDYESNHPTAYPPISLPLQEGQVEIDPTTQTPYVYSNQNGEHIWTPVAEWGIVS